MSSTPAAANDNHPRPASPRTAEFDLLLVNHIAALERRVRRLSNVGHDDIVSDTIATALRGWSKFDPAKGTFYNWLMLHARAVARDYRNKTQRYWDHVVLSDELPARGGAATQFDATYLNEVLSAADTRDGRAAVMVGLGYTSKEIGTIERLHPINANKRAIRGRAKLREFAGLKAAA